MVNFTRRHKIVILIIAIVITLTLGYKILFNNSQKVIEIEDDELVFQEEESEKNSQEESLQDEIVIHITGEIVNQGIVTLKNGSRVIDAINMAGGLTPLADERHINLAQKLFDEDKIIIPKLGDIIDDEPKQQDTRSSDSKEQVNINTASKEELKTLSGIGDVTADKIIDYRESTRFKTIEDIKNVSGIGDKKFEAIKSMITTR